MRILCLSVVLSGCLEYNFDKNTPFPNPGDTGEDTEQPDTGLIVGDCSQFTSPTAPVPALDEDCLQAPDPGAFDPVLEWRTPLDATLMDNPTYQQVFATPVVAHLTDDDSDGTFGSAGDTPDVAYLTYASYWGTGVLRVMSGTGTEFHYSVSVIEPEADVPLYPSTGGGVAIGDLEGDGFPELVINVTDALMSSTDASNNGYVCALTHTGETKWCYRGRDLGHRAFPSLADMDGDGLVEVIVGSTILNHDGTERGFGEKGWGGLSNASAKRSLSFAADIDQDGTLEVVTGNALYRPDGSILVETGAADGFPAVGNFDEDPYGELVVMNGLSGRLTLYDFHSVSGISILYKVWNFDLAGVGNGVLNGGPPTIADFDGDGEPEIGVAGGQYYHVVDTDGSLLWKMPVMDTSSAITGSSVFDFDSDGRAEVVYADEQTLWIFDGATGEVRFEYSDHDSRTQLEYPVIADVDADGSTEIILGQSSDRNNDGTWHGIVVLGSASDSWAASRQIWNQHAYSISNVNDDGSIPRAPETNWLKWNNFRAGATTEGLVHWLPDLEAWTPEMCLDECELDTVEVYLPIANAGLLDGDSVEVGFVRQVMGVAEVQWTETAAAVATGEGLVLGPFTVSSDDWGTGTLKAVIDIDETLAECNEDNNTVELGAWPCGL